MAKEKNNSNFGLSTKRVSIEKSSKKVLIAVCVAVVCLVVALVASQSLMKQLKYQAKVLDMRNKAVSQLEKNIKATKSLEASYIAFDTASESIMGNNLSNTKIVLNALPSKYDMPALATSLEGLMTTSGVSIVSITGTDEEATAEQSAADPQPKEMKFSVSAKGNYSAIQTFIRNIERSTRPIKISHISYKGSDNDLTVTITGTTYYQPLKAFEIKEEVVKPDGQKATTKQTTKSTTGAK